MSRAAVLSYARQVGEESRALLAAASSTRCRSQILRGQARRALARADEVLRSAPYARVVGVRGGTPWHAVVRRDGRVSGDARRPSVDPLVATLAVARECEQLTAVSILRAGWRAGACVRATAHFDGHPPRTTAALHEARDRLGELLNRTVVRQLFAMGLSATSLQHRTTDPVVQEQLGDIVRWLDGAILQLRSTVFDLGRHPGDQAPFTSVLGQVVSSLTALGLTASSLQRRTADPYVAGKLVGFVATLDQAIADLQRMSGALVVEPPVVDPPPAA